MRPILTCLFFCISFSHFFAQDFENYIPLESSGILPDLVVQKTVEKVDNERDKIVRSVPEQQQGEQESFLIESEHYIDKIMKSGSVLYNDPIGNYVNKVADKILEQDKKLRAQLSFYIIKSSAVNAFATDKGVIFINMATIARLENEAQLAFILCHEIIHFVKKHNLDIFLEKEDLKRLNSGKSEEDIEKRIIAENNYSKSIEKEADLGGLDLFLKSNYDLDAIDEVFELLHHSYLPMFNIPLKKDFFGDEHLQFPAHCWLDTVQAIQPIKKEEENEEKSTHPSPEERKAYLKVKLKKTDNNQRQKFLVSEKDFILYKKMATYELVDLYLEDGAYEEAAYHCYGMIKSGENNKYVKLKLGRALYDYSKHNLYLRTTSLKEDIYKDIEGESQQIYHLLCQLSDEETSLFVLQYCSALYLEYPNDEKAEYLCREMWYDLFERHRYDTSSFRKIVPPDSLRADSSKFIYFAYKGLLQNPDFIQQMEEMHKLYSEQVDHEYKPESKYYETPKILILAPFYYKIDTRTGDDQVKYIKSENARDDLVKIIKKQHQRFKIEIEILDQFDLQNDEVDKLNDINTLNNWIYEMLERYNMGYWTNEEQLKIDQIKEKYQSDYVAICGVISLKSKRNEGLRLFSLIPLTWVFIPSSIRFALTPRSDTVFFHTLLDLNTGKPVYYDYQEAVWRDSKALLKGHIYEMYYFMDKAIKRNQK